MHDAAGVGGVAGHRERLHLDRKSTPALERDRDAGARFGGPCERKSPEGSGTSAMPSPVISKQPTSSVGPKRFLRARMKRSDVCLSPSKWHTTSTRCSSTLGPATCPSFVTWPTMMIGRSRSFAMRISVAATSRTWLGCPAAPSINDDETVCTESTITSCGFTSSM